jgi:CelD/BcsL family acetyltransferase involved in cellulose biosynthesis
LNLITRKRHGLPPQPFFFFKNVFDHILSKGYGVIVTATHKEKVVSASVFFRFGKKALYKYGASELKYQSLRPNNLVMWEAFRWLKDRGVETIDLGRTETYNTGLLQFKRTWGGRESLLKYYRYTLKNRAFSQRRTKRTNPPYTRLFLIVPKSVLRIIGRLFYKHAG